VKVNQVRELDRAPRRSVRTCQLTFFDSVRVTQNRGYFNALGRDEKTRAVEDRPKAFTYIFRRRPNPRGE